MALFGYKGINASGSSIKGVLEAESGKELKTALRKEAVFLTQFWEMGKDQPAKKPFSLSTSVSFKPAARITSGDITTVTRQLATLTRAGIPLVEALSAVIDQADKQPLKVMLTSIRTSVNEGESFSNALAKYPKQFSNIFINMVNAGEQSGTLELVLERLADFMEGQAKIRSKVISAVAYPALMSVIGTLILGIMMGVVVPKVATIFNDFGAALPWSTRLLIFVSRVVSGYWWLLLPGIAGLIVLFSWWKKSEKGRPVWHRVVLRFPIFGELILMLAMGRFATTLGTMLASGVQVLRALEITKHILGNVQLEQVVADATIAVREGVPLHEAIQQSKIFPPLVTRMVAIGEKSGQLETMLANVARFYESRADARIAILTSILEPVLILVMGAGAGFVAFSILWPIMKINQLFG
jgi:general secretion pathway protein F